MLRNKIRLIFIVIGVVIYNASVVLFSWCFKLITDSLTMGDYKRFRGFIVYTIIVTLIQMGSYLFYVTIKNRYIEGRIIQLKKSFLTAIFNYEISDFKKKNLSEYQSFLFNDMSIYEQQAINAKLDLLEKIILMGFAAISIAIINRKFLLLIVVIVCAILFLPFLFGRYAKKYNEVLSDTTQVAMDKIAEMLNGFIVLRSLRIEKIAIEESEETISRMESAKKNYRNVMAFFQTGMTFLGTIITMVVFTWGGNSVINNNLSVGELIALIQLLFNVISPVMGIMTTISAIKASVPIKEKFNDFISKRRRDRDKELILTKDIVLNNITYRVNDKVILKNVELSLEKGKKYVVVGENGSGKSTLLKIIARVIDPRDYEGTVLFDCTDIDDIIEESFWRHISYLPQTCFIFNKDVCNNILMGTNQDRQKDSEELINVMDLDYLIKCDIVTEDTKGELSGGEKQKIAFVREMLKGSEILFVDEPDAALDVESGQALQNILVQSNKTVVMVTHRLSPGLEKFDSVIVMENGIVKQIGKYNDLKNNGVLRRIFHEDKAASESGE